MSARQNIRCKNMMYTQQMQHLPAQTLDRLIELIEKKLQPKKYAVIVHDKDRDAQGKPEEPHVHAMLSFDNARSCSHVASLLNDKAQYMEAWKGNAGNGYAYLVHATKDARMKYQYDPCKVTANFYYPAELQKMAIEVATSKQRTKVQILLDALYEGTITKEEVEQQLTGSQYGRFHRQIDDVWAKRLENLAQQWRKDMVAQGKKVKVIWIYGTAGTGKTSLAIAYAKKNGQEYFVSGSSRDIFQKYKGEHTLILDELRPNVIPYADLLRITDPFGVDSQVMAPSRYNDKALACDLIIITTPYNPYQFYYEIFGKQINPACPTNNTDSFAQLARRLSLIIEMTDSLINAIEYDPSKGFIKIPSASRKNPYSRINHPAVTNDAVTIFNSMFD